MTQDEMEQAEAFRSSEMNPEAWGDRRWLNWLARVETLTGIADLDGDRSDKALAAGTADAHSLDECYEWFDDGWSPDRAAHTITGRLG